MLNRLPVAAALVLACGLSAPAQTAEKTKLAWSLKVGDELYYAFTWNFSQKEDLGNMNAKDFKIRIHYTLTKRVTAVTDGVATIEATISSIAASVEPTLMGMPMGKMEYDSTTDNEASMLRAVRHAKGKTITFKLASNGVISDVSGGQAIRDAVSVAAEANSKEMAKKMNEGGGGGGGAMGGMMGPEMIGMLAARLTVAFDDETLRSTLNAVNHVLPDVGSEAVAEGDRWEHDIVEKLPQLGTFSFRGRYTHKGTTNGTTRLKMKPVGDAKLERDESEGGGNEFQEKEKDSLKDMKVLFTRVKGSATFGNGRLIASEIIQKIVSEGPVPPDSMLAGMAKPGEKLKATHELKLTYEQQDGPPAK